MTRSSYRRAYGRRTSRVRALWVVASALALHTGHMTGATTVPIELPPKEAGTFEIKCSEYCGRGHGRMRARADVTPRDVNTE